MTRRARGVLLFTLLLAVPAIGGCAGAIVGTAADVAIEVVKVPFKVVGAAVDVMRDDKED